VLGFLERLERSYSILTGAVDAGSSIGFGDVSGESSKADVLSSSSRGRSGSFIAKGLTKIVAPPCDSLLRAIFPRHSKYYHILVDILFYRPGHC